MNNHPDYRIFSEKGTLRDALYIAANAYRGSCNVESVSVSFDYNVLTGDFVVRFFDPKIKDAFEGEGVKVKVKDGCYIVDRSCFRDNQAEEHS